MESNTINITDEKKEDKTIKLKINLSKKEVIISPSSSNEDGLQKHILRKTKSRSGLKYKRPNKVRRVKNDTPDLTTGLLQDGRYVVEAIRQHRQNKKSGKEYLIKWIGWDDCHNTWEPAEHLDQCRIFVDRYENNLLCGKGKNSKAGPSSHSTKVPFEPTKQEISSSALDDSGLGQDEEFDSNEESLQQTVNLNNDESYGDDETLSFSHIRTSVRNGKIPVRLIHVTVVDGDLVYIVEHVTRNTKAEGDHWDGGPKAFDLNSIDIYLGKYFKLMYPQLVIQFYESKIVQLQPIGQDELVRKAAEAMAKHLERKAFKKPDTDEEEEDEKVKDTFDKFGLPNDLESSESDSDD